MKINPNVNVPSFLKAVQACGGDVYYVTSKGDRLSLKSTLTQVVFITDMADKLNSPNGRIILQDPADAVLLKEYCSHDGQNMGSLD